MIMISTKTAMMTEIGKIIDTPTLITKRIPITTMGNFPTSNHTTKMALIITITTAITTTVMEITTTIMEITIITTLPEIIVQTIATHIIITTTEVLTTTIIILTSMATTETVTTITLTEAETIMITKGQTRKIRTKIHITI